MAQSCSPLAAGRGRLLGQLWRTLRCLHCFLRHQREAAGHITQDNGQCTRNLEFPLGSGRRAHTEQQGPEPRPPSCGASISCSAWRCSLAWPALPLASLARRSAGGDNAWCARDLSPASTALPRTRPHLSPTKQAGRAGVHVAQITMSAAAHDVPATCQTLCRPLACAHSCNLTAVQKGSCVASLCWAPELRLKRSSVTTPGHTAGRAQRSHLNRGLRDTSSHAFPTELSSCLPPAPAECAAQCGCVWDPPRASPSAPGGLAVKNSTRAFGDFCKFLG